MHIFILSPQHFKLLPGGTAMGSQNVFNLGMGPIIMTGVVLAILAAGLAGAGGSDPVPQVAHIGTSTPLLFPLPVPPPLSA